MLWQDRAYFAVTGAGTLLSVAHYLATASSVSAPVPIHFNVCGVPDRFAAPWGFVFYPLTAVVLGVTAAATTLTPSAATALPSNSVEEIATRASILCGYAAVLISQLYAKRIAEGSASKLPSAAMGVVYGGLGIAIAAMLYAKYAS